MPMAAECTDRLCPSLFPKGLDFFLQDLGLGPQMVHLSKLGQCQLGEKMALAWLASSKSDVPPV